MSEGVLRSPLLEALAGIEHGFETRQGDLAARFTPLLRLRQVHGSDVIDVDGLDDHSALRAEAIEARPAADALVSGRVGTAVAVATADCVPVLLAEPEAGVVAAAHAGWRGIALGVLPTTVAVMAREHGADPATIVAAIGPRVGADSYRVGNDVRTAFLAAGLPESIFRDAGEDDSGRPTSWCDLGAAARYQLRGCGVRREAIDTIDACTVRDEERFWSYRRQGDAAGRMLSGIRRTGD